MGDMTMAVEIMGTSAMKRVMRKTTKEIGQVYSVYPYINGRERGICISQHEGRAVCFSENRNSDEVVVYVGRDFKYPHEKDAGPLNFLMDDGANYVELTDAIWEKHRYYAWCARPSLYKRMGEAIATFLLNEKTTERDLAAAIAKINKAAKKLLGY